MKVVRYKGECPGLPSWEGARAAALVGGGGEVRRGGAPWAVEKLRLHLPRVEGRRE